MSRQTLTIKEGRHRKAKTWLEITRETEANHLFCNTVPAERSGSSVLCNSVILTITVEFIQAVKCWHTRLQMSFFIVEDMLSGKRKSDKIYIYMVK